MSISLPETLRSFLTQHAESLDECADHSNAVLEQLAHAGLLGLGVPQDLGGLGGPLDDAVEAIAGVAELSLASAFMFWGHRAFIEYLVQSPNRALAERHLPDLIQGRLAGATGLSNAMKFLSGLEPLRIRASHHHTSRDRWVLQGDVPWATNVKPSGFLLAVAVDRDDGEGPFIAALPSGRTGLTRSADLDLIALRGSHTASLQVENFEIGPEDLIAPVAKAWLPRVRPAFLALQCGLSIGLGRSALAAAQSHGAASRPVLHGAIADAHAALSGASQALYAGVGDGRFVGDPVTLFELRIALAQTVQTAVQLELQASGGRAYHRDQPWGFARRWRESAFIPIVTPSITQLQDELQRRRRQSAPA